MYKAKAHSKETNKYSNTRQKTKNKTKKKERMKYEKCQTLFLLHIYMLAPLHTPRHA